MSSSRPPPVDRYRLFGECRYQHPPFHWHPSVAEVKRDPRSLAPLLGVSMERSGQGWRLGGKVLAIRTLYAGASFAALLTSPPPGHAAPRPIDVPAGTVGQAAFAIGRQASISVPTAAARRPAPAIRGHGGGRCPVPPRPEPGFSEEGRQQLCAGRRSSAKGSAAIQAAAEAGSAGGSATSRASKPNRHHRHRQQARYIVPALSGPMVADRRRIRAARRSRYRGDRGPLGRLFLDSSWRRNKLFIRAESPIPVSAARPSRRSANISATCAPATAGPILT